jgi:hypothetical protein
LPYVRIFNAILQQKTYVVDLVCNVAALLFGIVGNAISRLPTDLHNVVRPVVVGSNVRHMLLFGVKKSCGSDFFSCYMRLVVVLFQMYPREHAVVAERQTHHLEGVAGYARGGSNPLYRTKKSTLA